MSLMQSPVGIIILHETMVREEFDRNRHPRPVGPQRRQGPLMGVRTVAGRALIAIGTRLVARHESNEPVATALPAAR